MDNLCSVLSKVQLVGEKTDLAPKNVDPNFSMEDYLDY